jgi:hypothetical protein
MSHEGGGPSIFMSGRVPSDSDNGDGIETRSEYRAVVMATSDGDYKVGRGLVMRGRFTTRGSTTLHVF